MASFMDVVNDIGNFFKEIPDHAKHFGAGFDNSIGGLDFLKDKVGDTLLLALKSVFEIPPTAFFKVVIKYWTCFFVMLFNMRNCLFAYLISTAWNIIEFVLLTLPVLIAKNTSKYEDVKAVKKAVLDGLDKADGIVYDAISIHLFQFSDEVVQNCFVCNGNVFYLDDVIDDVAGLDDVGTTVKNNFNIVIPSYFTKVANHFEEARKNFNFALYIDDKFDASVDTTTNTATGPPLSSEEANKMITNLNNGFPGFTPQWK